jgi:hypothetical protein
MPCAGSNGFPTLGNSGVPEIGVAFSVTLSSARPNAPSTLLVGLSNTQWAGLTLPFNLSVIGGIGCNLYASGDIQLGTTTNGAGAASIAITFATNTALIGLDFYNQYIVFDSFNALGLVFSNRGDGSVGG